MDTTTDSESAATTAAADASGDSMSGGTSPESTAHSPMSNCSLDKFMEALETLSPGANDHHQMHSGKRQILAGGIRRVSSGSVNSLSMDTSPPCAGIVDENSRGRGSLGERSNASTSTTNPCSVISASSGWQTPRQRPFAAPVRCTSPGQKAADGGRDSGSSSATVSGGGVPVASGSLSRSPTSTKRKRSYAQLSSSPDDNGAPSPFPADGGSKNASRALSHSLLTVHQDGAYLQVTFDPSHRFVSEEDPPEPIMSSQFQADGPKEGRKDIDQALSLLQLSGGSSGSQGLNENMMSVSAEAMDSGSDVALPSMAATGGPGGRDSSAANSDAISPGDFDRSWNLWPGSGGSLGDIPSERQQGAAESSANRLLRSNGSSPVERNKAFDENLASANGKTNGNSVADRGGVSPRVGTRSSHAAAAAMAKSGDTQAAAGKWQGRGTTAATKHQQPPEPKMLRAAKSKSRMRGPGGGQRPAIQAPVSTPQGKTGGGPGSFCSKPEALSQLDTSQSESMVLDADLWIVRERGDVCTSDECIYKDKSTRISSRRHYHATCDHRHKGGPKGGMIFHHHQLEKIQKHQRAHIRILHKKTPAEAVLSEANVEPYIPEAWSEEETKVLAHLVGIYGPTHWGTISAGVGTKSETQCMLHWRYSLNGNETVKGTGTWQPVEDERMLSLVQIFGQRWSTVAEHMPGRLAKQCRERYLNNLDPDLRRGAWSREEDEKLLQLRGQLNKSFAKIAEQIEGRSYNDVKNRWSQISRQIAALKRASSERGGKGTRTNAGSSFTCGDGIGGSGEKDADESLDVRSGSGVSLNKMPLQTATNISNANSNVPSLSSSVSAMTTGTTSSALAAAPTVRYKVCMEGGVPTLCEVGEAGPIETSPGLRVSAACNVEPLPPASSLTATTSSVSSSMATSTAATGSSSAGHLLHHMVGPPSSVMAVAAGGMQQPSGMGSEGLLRPLYSGSDAPLSEGISSLVGVGGAAGAESVFGPPMTDAEAACIAAGPFMGFTNGVNDMRVSI